MTAMPPSAAKGPPAAKMSLGEDPHMLKIAPGRCSCSMLQVRSTGGVLGHALSMLAHTKSSSHSIRQARFVMFVLHFVDE